MSLESDPDVFGYVIAGTTPTQPKVEADWDGEVHRTLDTAISSLAECHTRGYPDYHLYELRRVPDGVIADEGVTP